MWTNDLNEIILWLALAFCGGMFGAAIGGLCAFVLCGFGAIISSVLMLAGQGTLSGFVDGWVTWGPLIGPQTAFVGGCWAAVYAKYHAGFENGRDICKPLAGLDRRDVLLVGGAGGLCGATMTWLFWNLPGFTVAGVAIASNNCVAAGVASAALIGRVLLGKSGPFGTVTKGVRRFVGSNNACWLPWQHGKWQIMLISIGVGFPTAYLTYLNSHTHLLIFGIMCVLFLFMILGQAVVAAHHIAICAYFATAATGNVAWGLGFAVLAGFLCEICAFLFTAHGDSHIDPPTVSITVCGTLQPVLLWLGLMPFAPMQGANTSAGVTKITTAFCTGGDLRGIIFLGLVLIFAPLVVHLLRQLPAHAGDLSTSNS